MRSRPDLARLQRFELNDYSHGTPRRRCRATCVSTRPINVGRIYCMYTTAASRYSARFLLVSQIIKVKEIARHIDLRRSIALYRARSVCQGIFYLNFANYKNNDNLALRRFVDRRCKRAANSSNFLMQIPNLDQDYRSNSQYCFNIYWKLR